MTSLSPTIIELLERGRETINARVTAARRASASIDEAALLNHIADVIAPAVEAAGAVRTEAGWPTLHALIDASLNLFASNQLGPKARSPLVRQLWTETLPHVARHLATHPRRVSAALSNSAVNLSSTPGVRAGEWLASLPVISARAADSDTFLRGVQVAAWRAGMVQYRDGAIAIARELPPDVARAALRIESTTDDALGSLLDAMASDPWHDPAGGGKASLKVVAAVGAFRGFSGDFLRPPTVDFACGALLASDGTATWRVLADRFGQLLVRHGPPLERTQRPTNELLISARGEVVWKADRGQFDELAGASSWACDGRTLAVAIPTSHRIFLLARTSAGAGGQDVN